MQTRDIVVENEHGLHLRVAAQIVEVVRSHSARVRLSRVNERESAGESVMELLLLDAPPGSSIHLEVDGPDEEFVANQISDLFSDGAGI